MESNVKQRILPALALVLPIVAAAISLFASHKDDIDFIRRTDYLVLPFSDTVTDGNSESYAAKDGGGIAVRLALHDKFVYPCAGFAFVRQGYLSTDMDHYGLEMDITSEQDLRMSVRIAQQIDDKDPLVMVKSFGINKGNNRIRIPVSDINEIPEWWYDQRPDFRDLVIEKRTDNVKMMWVITERGLELDRPYDFHVTRMTLVYDNSYMLVLLGLLLVAWYVALLIVYLVMRTRKSKEYVFMPIEKIDVMEMAGSPSDDMTEQILSFIGHNYSNPDLSQTDVAAHFALSDDRVGEILRETVGKTFRNYLNCLRMEETKRLLSQSSLQISDIAFRVGYNNIQHFNRVFKEYTGLTPKAYREQKQ